MTQERCGMQNQALEWSYPSGKVYADPFNQVELDVVFTDPEGIERRVPAFWAGGDVWRVRYASAQVGKHSWRSVCSDAANADLQGQEGWVEIAPYTGTNPLYQHGPLRVHESQRYLEHADGTPFFWLGDTWWMGLVTRLRWPEEFRRLTADRVTKGFTLVQIVAGLYPDMGAFDPRGRNEAGFPWTENWTRIRPEYFDMADLRIAYLVEAGLVPCIVGCWGYYMDFCGPEALKKHWRYLVARWGAYPVVWCVAGEVLMPWYLRKFADAEERRACEQKTQEQWQEVTRYLRSLDPWRHPVTGHPGGRGSREMLGDDLVDIEMLQTGHGGHRDIPNTLTLVTESVAQQPKMPVVNGEVSYEGIGGGCWEDVQRFMFWACLLSGAAGHTYGANGIWQMSTLREPYGPSPHGLCWGNTPWEIAYRLPGSEQVGIGKRLLERYEWWRLEPDFDAVQPRWSPQNYYGPYAARIPGQCRIIFLPTQWMCPVVRGLDRRARYRAFLFDLATGHEYDCGCFTPDSEGQWSTGKPVPILGDLLLVVEEVK